MADLLAVDADDIDSMVLKDVKLFQKMRFRAFLEGQRQQAAEEPSVWESDRSCERPPAEQVEGDSRLIVANVETPMLERVDALPPHVEESMDRMSARRERALDRLFRQIQEIRWKRKKPLDTLTWSQRAIRNGQAEVIADACLNRDTKASFPRRLEALLVAVVRQKPSTTVDELSD
eukprot:CAMPEP_0197415644 /NCGR_PEP_ID=MMETSP1170-20131217/2132_1 /TAXON_ID=54406 /ORGANISM="Sarcinochrysis sp, Strain CCMP770" /LENGTH=175 /DNA_ID=CAMNT_0042942473 /DNA_START=66 /DNA_END=593 /DNA_ORIENTATION=+